MKLTEFATGRAERLEASLAKRKPPHLPERKQESGHPLPLQGTEKGAGNRTKKRDGAEISPIKKQYTMKAIATYSIAKDGTYSIVCTIGKNTVVGVGNGLEEAKRDLTNGFELLKSSLKEAGEPARFLEQIEFDYRMDAASFLEKYSSVLTLTGLGKRSGINPKQLWKYQKYDTTPRRAQLDKLEKAIHELGQELLAIKL